MAKSFNAKSCFLRSLASANQGVPANNSFCVSSIVMNWPRRGGFSGVEQYEKLIEVCAKRIRAEMFYFWALDLDEIA